MIEFRTLGGVSLTATDGRELRSVLAQPKRLALLAYVASPRTPEFVPRGTLLGLFWPDREEERARHALRTSLHFLRRSLGPDVLVSRSEQEVGLDPDRLRCDVAELEGAIEAGDDAEALELYGGEYLPGVAVEGASEFERWVEAERRRLRLRARNAARRLTEAALQRGEGREAEGWARRAAALDPWDEATLQLLMRVLVEQGNRAGALRTYERFAERVREELRLEPSAETEALAAAIRTDRITTEARSVGSPENGARAGSGAPASTGEASTATEPAHVEPAGEPAPGAGGEPDDARASRWRPWMAVALVLVATGAILAYRARNDVSSYATVGADRPPATGSVRTIAVLPLENMSPDSSDAYFADAMTDELTSALSVVPGFQVVSRTSTSKFADSRDVGARVIADSLGAGYLVEGALVRAGDSLAIATRLVDGVSGRTLWSGRFARPVQQELAVQMDVARRIAESLRSSFTRKEEERFEAGQTRDPVARDAFFRAKRLLEPTTLLDSATAAQGVRLLRQAVASDSTFAAAWYWLGVGFRWERWVPHNSDSSRMAYDQAILHARVPWLRAEYRGLKAERLSERDSALSLARRAVRLNPGNPELMWNLSQAFKWKQDLPDALEWERKARDLDPLNPVRWWALGDTYFGLYLDRRAERAFREAIAIDSTYAWAWQGLLDLRTARRDYRGALALADTVQALEGVAIGRMYRGQIYVWMGEAARGRRLLEQALKTRSWSDAVWTAPEIVRARLATGDTLGADSLAHRAEAWLGQVAKAFRLSPGMPAALVELAAVQGQGAEAARRLRDYVKVATEQPFRHFLDDPDFGPVRSDTAFQHALAEVRARVMNQRQEAFRILDSANPR